MKIMELKKIGAALVGVAAVAVLLSACSPANEQAPAAAEPGEAPSPTATDSATCAAHGADKELCFICDPSLRDKGRLWCREHDRYEDRCWLCHPELEDDTRLWCQEHSLYEDECFLCHPELLEDDSHPAEGDQGASMSGEPAAPGLMCNEHGMPENECGICHPELLGLNPQERGLKVRLPSANSADRAGVVVSTPGVQSMEQDVECFAELVFDQNRLAHITSLVGGVVKSVEVDLGSRVSEGDLLARITSATIGEAQSAHVTALAEDRLRARTLERERSLLAERISSVKEYQEAEAAHLASSSAVQQTRQQLTVLGFDEDQIRALAEAEAVPGVLELRAPFAGEIVERSAVRGEMIDAGEPLFTLADPAVLWAMVNIPESQLSRLEIGQNVELTVESLAGRTFTGKLTWLSASVDHRTRMASGRVEVANAHGQLKAQMFARARIVTGTSDRALVVPQSAVQSVTGTPVVFVRSAADLFEARPVTLGATLDGDVEIASGLAPGEPVVVAGGFALKSQFLVSRLGAGCVHE